MQSANRGLNHTAAEQADLLCAPARAWKYSGNGDQLRQFTARLFKGLTMNDVFIALPSLDDAGNQFQHPRAVITAQCARAKLLNHD